jgi:hypothetical protein
MKAKDELSTTQTNLRNLRRIFVQFMLCFYRWLSSARALHFIRIRTSFFSYEHLSSFTIDYRRRITFAFEYSSQRHARSSRSNFMSLNIVYARNVDIHLSSLTIDYRRRITFAFEYSSQRHARSSRSNFMSFNIVYARNVNIRVTKDRFRKRFSSDNWSAKNEVLSRECWINCFR